MLEAIKMTKQHKHNQKCETIRFISDNKKLIRLFQKRNYTLSNIVQDSGFILSKTIRVIEKIKEEIEYVYYSE